MLVSALLSLGLVVGSMTRAAYKAGALDQQLIAVRSRLFTVDADVVERDRLIREAGWNERLPLFLRDASSDSAAAARWIPQSLLLNAAWGQRSAPERARELVLRMPGRGGGSCGLYRNLREKAGYIAAGSGVGCCSDFSEVFMLAAAQNGLQVREIMSDGHVFDEFFDASRRQWVFVDPYFGLFAKGTNGDLIDAGMLAQRILRREPLEFILFKDTVASPFRRHYIEATYTPSVAKSMRLVLGSNVVAQDRLESKLRWLPKPASQLIGFLLNTRPRYLDFAVAKLR